MRIGIDGRLWNETGVGRYIRNLVKELSLIDETNEYVLFVGSKDAERIKKQELRSKEKWKIVSVDIRWHTLEEQLKFPKVLNKENLDLMHFTYFSIPIFYNRPFVVTIHDLILNHFPTGKASTLPLPIYQGKRLGYKYILANAIKNAKKIIVPLNAVKEDLMSRCNVSENKIVVTTEGVDSSLRASKMSEAISKNLPAGKAGIAASPTAPRNDNNLGKYFLYIGNAYPHKNLEKLIKAFSQLIRHPEESEGSSKRDRDSSPTAQNDNVKLILVGKNDFFYKRLKEKIKNRDLENLVIFDHDVTDEQLANYYRGAIAFASASFMEGFGLPALEAISLRCLPLLSDIPSFREVCGDAAIYFNPNSVDDIKNKMEEALALTDEKKKKYIASGIKRVRQFSWEKMAKETLEIYNSIQ